MSFEMLFLALFSGLVIFATAWRLARWTGDEPTWPAKIGWMIFSYFGWIIISFVILVVVGSNGGGSGAGVILVPMAIAGAGLLPTMVSTIIWIVAPYLFRVRSSG